MSDEITLIIIAWIAIGAIVFFVRADGGHEELGDTFTASLLWPIFLVVMVILSCLGFLKRAIKEL